MTITTTIVYNEQSMEGVVQVQQKYSKYDNSCTTTTTATLKQQIKILIRN